MENVHRINKRGVIQTNCFADAQSDIGDAVLVAEWDRKCISLLRGL